MLCSYFIIEFLLKYSCRMGDVKKMELNTFLLLTYVICQEIILLRGNGELPLKFSSLLSTVHWDKYCSAVAATFK